MSCTNFNRHENMDRETLFEIGDILNEVRWDSSFELTNMLSGLYDGYLYDTLLSVAKRDVDFDMYNRIETIVNIVKKYPKL